MRPKVLISAGTACIWRMAINSPPATNASPLGGLHVSSGSARPVDGMGMRITFGVAMLWLGTASAEAQYIGGRPPEPPPAPIAGSSESPESALARNIRLLAINPRNYEALLGAGRAALRLGDAQAAIGFFGRAEEVNSAHWAPKAGQASALVHMGEAAAALGLFEQAQRLGATQSLVALDRGLAFDLLGRQADAQTDYRAVLAGPDQAEAQRRLALSLAITGRKADALSTIDPLVARRDNAARRSRAFILALTGDVDGARSAIGALMPGTASGFDPFLRRLASLNPGQKAAAVHLGMMPAEGAALALVEDSAPPAPAPVRVTAVRPPPRAVEPRPNATRLAEIESSLTSLPAAAIDALPPPPPAPRPVIERTPPRRVVAPERTLASRPPSEPVASTRPSRTASVTASTRRKTEEKPTARTAERERGAEKDTPASRRAAASTERASTGSRIYVQLAGGSNTERMDREFKRIRTAKPALFRGRQPVVSEVRGWARLLVGPFKDQDEAQEFVNDLNGAKLEGFVWTAPAGTRFDKLAAK